jgi:AcrR family transcriptional regulator
MKAKRRLTRQESQQLTRSRLIEAAGEVFLRSGFDAASVEEIAEQAGFSRGAFYSNFSSKDDLVLALLDEHSRERRGLLEGIFREKQGAHDRFRAAREWYAAQCQPSKWSVLKTEFQLRALRNPDLREHLAALWRQEMDAYSTFIAKYFVDADTTAPAQSAVISLALIATSQWLGTFVLTDTDPETARLAAAGSSFIFDSIFAPADRDSAPKRRTTRKA